MQRWVNGMCRAIVAVGLLVGAAACRPSGNGLESTRAALNFETGNVAGTVLWNGAPVTDGSISLEVPSLAPGVVHAVDSAGHFEIDNVMTGTFEADVHVDGFAETAATTTLTVVPGTTTTTNIDLTSSLGLVTATITSNGTPAVGHIDFLVGARLFSDASGHASGLVPAGPTQAVAQVGQVIKTFSATIPAGGTLDLGTLDIDSGSLSVVALWNGLPASVPADQVTLILNGPNVGNTVTSASPLSVSLADAQVGTYSVWLQACNQFFGPTNFDVSEAQLSTVNVPISNFLGTASWSITVQGLPVATPFVTINQCGEKIFPGPDGSFTAFLPQGQYVVTIPDSTGRAGPTFSFTSNVGLSSDLGNVTVGGLGRLFGSLSWNGADLFNSGGLSLILTDGAGAVLSPSPNFVGGAVVFDPGTNVTTDSGIFTTGTLIPGQYHVSASVCQGSVTFPVGNVDVSAGSTSSMPTLNLDPLLGTLTGTLVAPPSVTAIGLAFQDGCGSADVSNGQPFTLPGVPPGNHVVAAFDDSANSSHGSLGTFPMSISAGQVTDLGTINLSAAPPPPPTTGSVQVNLTWKGAPLPSFIQGVSAELGGSLLGPLSGSTFSASNVPAGPQPLSLQYCVANLQIGTVDVVAGSTTTRTIDLATVAGRVSGFITENGAPLNAGDVTFHPANAAGPETYCMFTDPTGHFLGFVPPADYTVGVVELTFGHTIGRFNQTVAAGDDIGLDAVATPAGSGVGVDLSGGEDVPGGITLTFTNVTGAGETTFVTGGSCATGCTPPPTGYEILGGTYFDLSTTALYDSVKVCVGYDPATVCAMQTQDPCDETMVALLHDSGSGFVNIATEWHTDTHVVCGFPSSFSPFALAVPVSLTPPKVTVPADMVVGASGPGGATVTFTATATDVFDGTDVPSCSPASGTMFPVGVTTVTCSATDSARLTGTASFTVTVRDVTAPVISGVPSTIVAYATSTAGAKVAYTAPTAADDIDGPRPVTCSLTSGAQFPVGKTVVQCNSADGAGNAATPVAFTVWVQYQAPADGTFFGQPINPDGSSIFKKGSAIPVKFSLRGASAGITNAIARFLVAQVSNAVTGTFVEAVSSGAADTGNTFRFDGSQYSYNLSTRSLATGTWSLKVDLGDGVAHSINVSLR